MILELVSLTPKNGGYSGGLPVEILPEIKKQAWIANYNIGKPYKLNTTDYDLRNASAYISMYNTVKSLKSVSQDLIRANWGLPVETTKDVIHRNKANKTYQAEFKNDLKYAPPVSNFAEILLNKVAYKASL